MSFNILLQSQINTRKKLLSCKFSSQWSACFVKRHSIKMAQTLARLVDYANCVTFNVFETRKIFRKIASILLYFNAIQTSLLYNLDETGFKLGRNMAGIGFRGAVIAAFYRSCNLHPKLSYCHRITVSGNVLASGFMIAFKAVFYGKREPYL